MPAASEPLPATVLLDNMLSEFSQVVETVDEQAGESSRTFQPYVQALLAIRDEFRSIQSDLELTRESLAQAQAKAGHALNLVEQLVSRLEVRPENQGRQDGVNFYHDDVSDLR